MWIVIAGDIFEGITSVVGLFETREDADDYADSHNMGHYPKASYEIEEAKHE